MAEILTEQKPLINQCSDLYLLEKKYEVLLEMSNKKLLKEINDIKQEILRLNTEVESLKQKSSRPIQVVHEEFPRQQPVQQIQQPQQQRPQQLTSEDVSIEKYFHFGRKQR